MKSLRLTIQRSLFAALRINYKVEVRKDGAGAGSRGFVADAKTRRHSGVVKATDLYFFAYGKTKPAALAGLSASIEGCFRRRADRYRTGLNTLLGGR
jgi:hypothetical protein